MNRFEPDTWLAALLRPVAMVVPDSHVYVEMMAPDFRWVVLLLLLVLLGVMRWRAREDKGAAAAAGAGARPAPVFVLVAALAVAFVPWLMTSGNGRYFLAGLLMVGPVCIGLAWRLPATRALRLSLAVGIVAVQAFAVQQTAPWQAWMLAQWKEPPYFQVELPADAKTEPATYVTLSVISYSVVIPQFHPQSRWINLAAAPPPGTSAFNSARTAAFFSQAQGKLRLLVPVVPGMLTEALLPDAQVAEVIDSQLAPFGLGFAQPQACRFLHSRSLASMGLSEKTEKQRAQSGFWLCELRRIAPGTRPSAYGRRHDAVFAALERQCPRFLPANGDGPSLAVPSGEVRSYLQAEMKVYVYDDGQVLYKYYRDLNPVFVGKAQDILAGQARIDCAAVRPAFPWGRHSGGNKEGDGEEIEGRDRHARLRPHAADGGAQVESGAE